MESFPEFSINDFKKKNVLTSNLDAKGQTIPIEASQKTPVLTPCHSPGEHLFVMLMSMILIPEVQEYNVKRTEVAKERFKVIILRHSSDIWWT